MVQRVTQRAETSGRVDDNPTTLELRQQGFAIANAPVAAFYRSLGRLVEVSSNPVFPPSFFFPEIFIIFSGYFPILTIKQVDCNRPLDDIYEEFKTIVEVSQHHPCLYPSTCVQKRGKMDQRCWEGEINTVYSRSM